VEGVGKSSQVCYEVFKSFCRRKRDKIECKYNNK
jgi:hypothetical protein